MQAGPQGRASQVETRAQGQQEAGVGRDLSHSSHTHSTAPSSNPPRTNISGAMCVRVLRGTTNRGTASQGGSGRTHAVCACACV